MNTQSINGLTPEECLGVIRPYDFSLLRAENNTSELKAIAAQLFNRASESIQWVRLDTTFAYGGDKDVQDTRVDRYLTYFDDNTLDAFYAGREYQGSWRKALGMALSNLLVRPDFSIASCGTITFSREISGRLCSDVTIDEADEEVEFEYGKAITHRNAFRLGDRHDQNIVLGDDGTFRHIDFDSAFSSVATSKKLFDFIGYGFELSHTDAVRAGQHYLRNVIAYNLEEKRELVGDVIAEAYARGGVPYNRDPIRSIEEFLDGTWE